MFSYLTRHWRGELPLATSWWLNCALLSVLLLLTTISLAGPAERALIDSTGEFALFAALLALACAIVPTWQLVGLWRAAERHGHRLRGQLPARATEVVATLFMLWVIVRGLELIGDWTPTTQMALNLGPFHAELIEYPGRRELEIRGGFGFGLATRVERALEHDESIRRLRLNSRGGSWAEAGKLRRLIQRHMLNTYSSEGCRSACVSAFIAGQHRYLDRSAGLGLQMPAEPWRDLELAAFARQKVPLWFTARWRAQGTQIWFPSPAELRASGIVHTFLGELPPDGSVYGSVTGDN
jgi:hypothetical protein